MCLNSYDETTVGTVVEEQEIELILDLTRRIQLLEELMTAARAKRYAGAQTTTLSNAAHVV